MAVTTSPSTLDPLSAEHQAQSAPDSNMMGLDSGING